MVQANKTADNQKKKIYFIYFIIFSLIVLLIFAFLIIGTFWDYRSQIKKMENFYRSRVSQVVSNYPKINSFDPIKGQADAKVTIFEYGDIFCQNCQAIQADLASIEKLYGNQIRIVYKGLPVTTMPENRTALNAAYCAWEQNAFWDFKDLLYQDPLILNRQKYLEYASKLNLDLNKFTSCLDVDKYQTVIDQNLVEALSLQISSIPTLYVNEQKLEGVFNFSTLKNLIDLKLKSQ